MKYSLHFLFVLLLVTSCKPTIKNYNRPNIVLIMADDIAP